MTKPGSPLVEKLYAAAIERQRASGIEIPVVEAPSQELKVSLLQAISYGNQFWKAIIGPVGPVDIFDPSSDKCLPQYRQPQLLEQAQGEQ